MDACNSTFFLRIDPSHADVCLDSFIEWLMWGTMNPQCEKLELLHVPMIYLRGFLHAWEI